MVLSHKRRTKLLSSIPYAYSGFFSITSGILLTTSILYIVFLPGIALGQGWLEYENSVFRISYPAFLSAYEVPSGVQFIPQSEIGSGNPSFLFKVSVQPYNGPSQNHNELASEMAYQLVQTNPNAQIISVGLNGEGNLAEVHYTDGNFYSVAYGTVYDGKLYLYGFTYVMGSNEAEYQNIGLSITNSMVTKRTTISDADLAATQTVLDNWAKSNPGSAEYCQLHRYDNDPSC